MEWLEFFPDVVIWRDLFGASKNFVYFFVGEALRQKYLEKTDESDSAKIQFEQLLRKNSIQSLKPSNLW